MQNRPDLGAPASFTFPKPQRITVGGGTVVALDERFATVGSQDLRVEAGADRTVHRQVTLRTTHRAVSGTVKDCRTAP